MTAANSEYIHRVEYAPINIQPYIDALNVIHDDERADEIGITGEISPAREAYVKQRNATKQSLMAAIQAATSIISAEEDQA